MLKNAKIKLALLGVGVLMAWWGAGGCGTWLGDVIGDIIVLRGVD